MAAFVAIPTGQVDFSVTKQEPSICGDIKKYLRLCRIVVGFGCTWTTGQLFPFPSVRDLEERLNFSRDSVTLDLAAPNIYGLPNRPSTKQHLDCRNFWNNWCNQLSRSLAESGEALLPLLGQYAI